MGVVSNGMLCSGDELGLTADADGILILPPDDAARRAADRPVRRRRARRRRQAQPRRRPVDRRSRPRGRGGDGRAASRCPGPTSPETGRPRRAAPAGRGRGPDAVPAVRRALGERRHASGRRRTASRCGCSRPASGPISNVVDASQLRDARAGQADPHVRCRRRPRRPDHRPAGAPGRAARDARPRRARRSTRTRSSSPTRRGPIGDRRRHGRRRRPRSRDATTDVVVESAIFDPVSIRRTAFRYALRSEASLRFEKGQEIRLARLGADRTARLIARLGRRRGRAGRGRHEPGRARAGARRVPARPGQPPARRRTIAADEQRALLARVGVDHRAGAAARHAIAVAAGPQPLEVDAGEARGARGHRPDAGVATCVIEADVTEEVARVRGYELIPAILPHTPMPPYRPDRRSRVRDAVRETLAGAGLTEVVTLGPRRARARSSGSRALDDGPLDGEGAAGGRPVTRHQPAVEPALGPPPDASSAACSRSSRRTSATAATTSRSSRSARATARRTTATARVVAARASR